MWLQASIRKVFRVQPAKLHGMSNFNFGVASNAGIAPAS
jgi:hypothetical protein